MSEHYLIISILIALMSMVPFFIRFERKNVQARELVILAVLIATAVAGRAAFFMLPNFKPMLAIVIIAGAALGKESGFMVGAMSAFVSNFLFGQGPWTPFQMTATAICGYLAGLIFYRMYENADCSAPGGRETFVSDKICYRRMSIRPQIVYGAIAAFFPYGAIVDIWTIFAMTQTPTVATVIAVYGAALYFNAVHAGATAVFLLLLGKPIMRKLGRVRKKYGLNGFT